VERPAEMRITEMKSRRSWEVIAGRIFEIATTEPFLAFWIA